MKSVRRQMDLGVGNRGQDLVFSSPADSPHPFSLQRYLPRIPSHAVSLGLCVNNPIERDIRMGIDVKRVVAMGDEGVARKQA